MHSSMHSNRRSPAEAGAARGAHLSSDLPLPYVSREALSGCRGRFEQEPRIGKVVDLERGAGVERQVGSRIATTVASSPSP
jgi:hypothetical protein